MKKRQPVEIPLKSIRGETEVPLGCLLTGFLRQLKNICFASIKTGQNIGTVAFYPQGSARGIFSDSCQ